MDGNLSLISQKLLAPSFYEKMLLRPRLTQRIKKSEANIVMIVAPAGFGKTVLLSQLTEAFRQPAVWYQLDEYDNDPAVVWRYLIEGCKRLNPAFGNEIISFLDTGQAGLNRGRTVLSMLVKELDKHRQANTLFHTVMHTLRRVLEEQTGRKDLILYRGDYLEELDYTWLIPEQEYLKQLYNRARDRLSAHYLDKKEYLQARIHLEHLVRGNPLTEEYCRRLILASAAVGDLKSVSSQYHRLRACLKDELGIAPSKEIQELYSPLIVNY